LTGPFFSSPPSFPQFVWTEAGEVRESRLFPALPASEKASIHAWQQAISISSVDLAGRRVSVVDISTAEYANRGGRVRHSLRQGVPAGLYIVKFKGKSIATDKTVPAFRRPFPFVDENRPCSW
jgi:hypothetical protein